MDRPVVDPDHARNVATQLAEQWDISRATRPFRSTRWNGEETTPTLHLEDITGIPFVDGISGVEEYQHRARVRADTGDLFAAGTTPADGYEQYSREMLGLGSPEFVHATGEDPMAVARACLQPDVFDVLARRAAEAGRLVVHPYMAIESVWELARRLTHETDADIHVIGPPPPVLWVANDKSHFSRLVAESLSSEWLVETHRSRSPEQLAEALAELARDCQRVGLKRTRCASAMGNAVFDADDIRGESVDEIENRVHEFLNRTRWHHDEDVLAVQWCDTDLSPSTQLWIPPKDAGLPHMEGVYEQILDGPEKVFVGSRPSSMPESLNEALADASIQVATALQQMGYVGRCSFDFIVVGQPGGDCRPMFIECNGRWGGTSTPMHLVDRLIGGERPDYIATDYYLPKSHLGMTFAELRDALESQLYDPATGEGRFILYNVGPLLDYGKFDVITLGESPEHAAEGLDEVLPELLGI